MPLSLGSVVNLRARPSMIYILQCLLVLVSLTSITHAVAQDGTVNSKLSATTITRDESVTLEIVAIGMDAELDISSLDKDFEVVGRSSSREVNSVLNASGRLQTTSTVKWAVQLLPKDIGIFTVPPIRVGNVRSQSHTLTVNDLPTGAQRDIFVEAVVDTTTPWVQSQVLMTLKVFQAIDIIDGGLDVPEGDGLVVERLGEDTRSTETREGRQYSVTTRQFALFPQKSGAINLEPITLSVSVHADSTQVRTFFSPTRKLTRRTDNITLNVKPRPASGSAWWLPAQAVQLDSQWIGNKAEASVDQPLTRTITLRASGAADTQLPDINIPAVEGASVYAEQPIRKLGANAQGVLSELTLKWVIIPQREGVIELPPVAVEWFNTRSGSVETAVLPAETIQVTAAPSVVRPQPVDPAGPSDAEQLTRIEPAVSVTGEQAQTDQLTPSATLSPALVRELGEIKSELSWWRSVALLVLLLWVLSALYYWWSKSTARLNSEGRGKMRRSLGAIRNTATASLASMQPLGGVAASCKNGDLETIRSALIEWSSRQWPDDSPLSLNALVKQLHESPAKESVKALDAALYSGRSSPESAEQLLLRLRALPEQLKAAVEISEKDSAANQASGQVTSGTGLPTL